MKTHIHVQICNDTLKLLKSMRMHWEAQVSDMRRRADTSYDTGYMTGVEDCIKDLDDDIALLESALDEVTSR